MFCSKCGQENYDGARFCNECGAALTERDTPQPYIANRILFGPTGRLDGAHTALGILLFTGVVITLLLWPAISANDNQVPDQIFIGGSYVSTWGVIIILALGLVTLSIAIIAGVRYLLSHR